MTDQQYFMSGLFQRELLAILLQDPSVYDRFPTLWDPKHFSDSVHRQIAHAFFQVRHYGQHPNEASLTQELFQGAIVLTTVEQEILKELKVVLQFRPTNINYVLDTYRKHAKNQNVLKEVERSIGLFDSGKYMEAAERIIRAASAGDDAQLADKSFFTDPPKLAMEIIPGVLRVGYIGILNSMSKAYKSWNLLALAIAAATGKSWLGFPACNPVRTLYVNLELDAEEFKVRVDKVAKAMGTTRADLHGKLDFLN